MSEGSGTSGIPGKRFSRGRIEAASAFEGRCWLSEEHPARTAIATKTTGTFRIEFDASTSNVRLFLRSGYGLVKIPNDIIQVLDSDGDPHQVLGDTGFQLLVVTQLLVRGGSGMDNKALGVSQVGQMR